MNIPEGSLEADFQGRRLAAGWLGSYEVYVSVVWRGVRHLWVAGASVAYDNVWFRRRVWTVDIPDNSR